MELSDTCITEATQTKRPSGERYHSNYVIYFCSGKHTMFTLIHVELQLLAVAIKLGGVTLSILKSLLSMQYDRLGWTQCL